MQAVDRVLDALDAAARWLAMLLATAIIVILAAQIVFRYFLNHSIVWSEEVATWCLVWVVFLGAATIMRRWDHVHIPMLIRRLPLAWRPAVIILAKLLTCVAVILIAYYGVQVVLGPVHVRSQVTDISTRWIKLAVPVGAGLMALFALRAALEDMIRWRRGDMESFRTYGDLPLDESAVREATPT